MAHLKKAWNNLKDEDFYSMLLFVLFKLKDTKEFGSLSELCYILDMNNFLKFLQFFEGMTLNVPTLEELSSILNCILLYKYINIDSISYQNAVEILKNQCTSNELELSLKNYSKVEEALKDYVFAGRSNELL